MHYPTNISFTGNGGCDKQYYHNEGDFYGWLEFKDSSKKKEEDECYNALKTIKGINLPDRISDSSTLPTLLDNTGNPFEAKCGCYIKHLNITKTLKPM